jgi:2-methylisocitrate lyase-like PEP mutase family enzyme
MRTQADKGRAFRALHERDHAFIIPNPWDTGTARLLAGLGFEALATTSAGYAFSCGQRDNTIGRERMLAHVRDIVQATDLPVSADLENGFGDAPSVVADTIRLAAAAGLAGASIEDMSNDREAPIYDTALAAERIRAAAEVVRDLAVTFTLTARAADRAQIHAQSRDLRASFTVHAAGRSRRRVLRSGSRVSVAPVRGRVAGLRARRSARVPAGPASSMTE